jgi:preprotein translocase subunit YajC
MEKNMRLKLSALLGLLFVATNVLADGAAPAGGMAGGGLGSLVMFGALFVMMYFLMIRPQSKRAKEHRNLLASLTKGDEVITQGGLLGRIERDAGSFFILALSEGVEVPVQKQSITQLLPKGTLKSI